MAGSWRIVPLGDQHSGIDESEMSPAAPIALMASMLVYTRSVSNGQPAAAAAMRRGAACGGGELNWPLTMTRQEADELRMLLLA